MRDSLIDSIKATAIILTEKEYGDVFSDKATQHYYDTLDKLMNSISESENK